MSIFKILTDLEFRNGSKICKWLIKGAPTDNIKKPEKFENSKTQFTNVRIRNVFTYTLNTKDKFFGEA